MSFIALMDKLFPVKIATEFGWQLWSIFDGPRYNPAPIAFMSLSQIVNVFTIILPNMPSKCSAFGSSNISPINAFTVWHKFINSLHLFVSFLISFSCDIKSWKHLFSPNIVDSFTSLWSPLLNLAMMRIKSRTLSFGKLGELWKPLHSTLWIAHAFFWQDTLQYLMTLQAEHRRKPWGETDPPHLSNCVTLVPVVVVVGGLYLFSLGQSSLDLWWRYVSSLLPGPDSPSKKPVKKQLSHVLLRWALFKTWQYGSEWSNSDPAFMMVIADSFSTDDMFYTTSSVITVK